MIDQVWKWGDRVEYTVKGADFGTRGTVIAPKYDRDASQQHHVFVQWDDGSANFADVNSLNAVRKG